jgi:hypothetical protein
MRLGKSKFVKLINDIAETNEWEIEWKDDMASIDFEATSGNTLTLYINNNPETIEFDVTSDAVFDSEKDAPQEISTLLLKRNILLNVGAWALEEWDGQWYYSLVYNVTAEELEPMEYDLIQSKVDALIQECDEFNVIWAEENG